MTRTWDTIYSTHADTLVVLKRKREKRLKPGLALSPSLFPSSGRGQHSNDTARAGPNFGNCQVPALSAKRNALDPRPGHCYVVADWLHLPEAQVARAEGEGRVTEVTVGTASRLLLFCWRFGTNSPRGVTRERAKGKNPYTFLLQVEQKERCICRARCVCVPLVPSSCLSARDPETLVSPLARSFPPRPRRCIVYLGTFLETHFSLSFITACPLPFLIPKINVSPFSFSRLFFSSTSPTAFQTKHSLPCTLPIFLRTPPTCASLECPCSTETEQHESAGQQPIVQQLSACDWPKVTISDFSHRGSDRPQRRDPCAIGKATTSLRSAQ